MYVDLDNLIPCCFTYVYFLNRDKILLLYVYFHIHPSWNIHAICSTLFKGHTPKLFFQLHIICLKYDINLFFFFWIKCTHFIVITKYIYTSFLHVYHPPHNHHSQTIYFLLNLYYKLSKILSAHVVL